MMKYWRTIAISFMVISVSIDFWDVFKTLPITLDIMLAFMGLVLVLVTAGFDIQDELIDMHKETIGLQESLIKKQESNLNKQDELIQQQQDNFNLQDDLLSKKDRRIKAQQDFIDNNLWAALKAVYVNGEQKGFGRNNVGNQVSEEK